MSGATAEEAEMAVSQLVSVFVVSHLSGPLSIYVICLAC